jgi:hypothetical protein
VTGKRNLLSRIFCLAVLAASLLPSLATAANQTLLNAPASLRITGPGGMAARLSVTQIRALPAIAVNAAFATSHGPFKAVFSGPLLWTVLNAAAAVDPKAPKAIPREYALITGADGYAALLAPGEISPLFEAKHVILATRMNGQDLGPLHLRLIVPGDNKGGRSVRDVVSIAVSAAGVSQH